LLDVGFMRLDRSVAGWEVIVIAEFGKHLVFSPFPGKMMVVCDEDHVIGVDCSEGREAVANHREQGDQDVIDDVDDVELSTSNVDPT
jgi:hypothetical protein